MTRLWAVLACAALVGCVVRPAGEAAARERAVAAGAAYEKAFAERDLPALAADASLADWLAHAERANGALEAAWLSWIAALEQIPQAATQDTTAMLGVEHRLDGGSALDRTGVMLMSDAMNNLLWPGRLASRGESALARARVAAAEFDRARLGLQTDVAQAFWALARRDVEIALQERLRGVLAVNVPSVRARVQAGGAMQTELLAAEIALLRAEADLARLRAGRPGLVAELRAVAGVAGDVDPRPALAELEPLREPERAYVARALERNPELEMRRRAHEAALAEITEREWLRVPEFAGRGLLMGDGVATLAGAFTLPFLRGTAIEAAVRQAQAQARAADALRRQAGSDAVARVLAELAALQAVDGEAAVLREQLLPRARTLSDVARASWAAGGGAFADWAQAVVLEVEVERLLAALRMEHAIGRARLVAAVGG
jgi:outer membrane protein TolC